LMVNRNALPSYIALPWIAAVVFIIQLVFFGTDITIVSANIASALVAVQTPVTVIFGAILFNRFSEISGATNTLRKWLGNINPNPVAQIMIIGWSFTFMIEGASGFGTPAAIAAPILVGLGFPALKVAMLTLVMNSVPVSFGAVGTPT
ncbi:L-lactate permease, partial [Aggregatibacter actinomycetemcomitans]